MHDKKNEIVVQERQKRINLSCRHDIKTKKLREIQQNQK
jgi:hypothetical protein